MKLLIKEKYSQKNFLSQRIFYPKDLVRNMLGLSCAKLKLSWKLQLKLGEETVVEISHTQFESKSLLVRMGGWMVDKTKIMQCHLKLKLQLKLKMLLLFKNQLVHVSQSQSNYLSGGWVGGWVQGKTIIMQYSTQFMLQLKLELSLAKNTIAFALKQP